nr:mannan endo-1,4-beta-mannosidase 6-like isoform X1 [Populus alba]
MNTHKRIFGFKIIFFVSIFILLNECLKCSSFGVMDGDQWDTTVEEVDNHLPSSSSSQGASELNDVGEDEWQMVAKKGNQFVINDQTFYVNGFNTYWLMVFAADQSTRGKVTEVFQQASSVGLTVCRTWAFNDGQWRALQKSPGVYDEDVFKVLLPSFWAYNRSNLARPLIARLPKLFYFAFFTSHDFLYFFFELALDFVVSEAKKYKIRLILSLTNNWDAYGGKAQYVKWGKATGLNLTSDDDFFSHPTLRSYYKAHVKAVLNRVNTLTNITYKDDPTIFAWELMNEPRCTSDPSGDKLQSWITDMAVYVKSMDAKHLVEIGLEGFYGPSAPDRAQFNPNSYATQVGTDFIRNHQVLGVDFASVHIYADSWISQTISDSHIQFIESWMGAHIEDAERYLGMPVVFAEFGVSSKDPGYNSSFRDTMISTVYKTLLNSTKRGGSGAGSLLWQIFPDGTDYMDDGYAIVLSKSPSTSNIISLQSTRVAIFNSMCSWKCKWGCKKKNPLEAFFYHDDL